MSEIQNVKPGPEDVQGNILTEYKDANHATYLFYRVDLPDLARLWLARLLEKVTTEAKWVKESPPSTLNVAMTFQGLKALGVSPSSLKGFPQEFKEGMKNRATVLCDFVNSDPQHWEEPLGQPQVHVLILIHGKKRDDCNQMMNFVRQAGEAGGVTCLGSQEADGLRDGKEHFGFKDGISQPWIEDTKPGPPVEPYGGKRTKDSPTPQPLKLGEFLLGYKDELDRYPEIPKPDLLVRNGTYLVLRKLSKNVQGFWEEMERQAESVFGKRSARERLAALMMGRWMSGCPVAVSEKADDLKKAKDAEVNKFTYDDDPAGNKCPVGAHIRRTHPRDLPQNMDVEPISTRHRMIRRGLHYGPPYTKPDGKDRGSIFIALVGDIGRQFEFVQRHWVNNGDPFRVDRTDRDPVIGNNWDERDLPPKDEKGQPQGDHKETRRKFTVPAADRVPWALNLPEFVTTKGGEYFFLPSKTALIALSRSRKGVGEGGLPSFLEEYSSLEKAIADPRSRAEQQRELVYAWIGSGAKDMFDDLRRNRPVFQMPGYPQQLIFPTTIVTKYEDVIEVLDREQHPEFSVKPYGIKMDIEDPMRPQRGPFILGMEWADPKYQAEQKILLKAVQASPPLTNEENIRTIIAKILDPILKGICARPTRKFDVIQDLAWPLLLAFNNEFFGVPAGRSQQWLRHIFRDIFRNPLLNLEWMAEADRAVLEMNAHLDGVIQQTTAQYKANPKQVRDSVLKALIEATNQLDFPRDLAPNFIRRNLMGLLVPSMEENLRAIAKTIDQLIRRPDQLKDARIAAKDRGKDVVRQYAFEAMRLNPQNPVLARMCVKDTEIAGTPIPKWSLVFAATMSAMFDDSVFLNPDTFDHTRFKWVGAGEKRHLVLQGKNGDKPHLIFGYEGHQCLGRYLNPIILEEVLTRVLALDGLARDNDDPFDPFEPLPNKLKLTFTPEH